VTIVVFSTWPRSPRVVRSRSTVSLNYRVLSRRWERCVVLGMAGALGGVQCTSNGIKSGRETPLGFGKSGDDNGETEGHRRPRFSFDSNVAISEKVFFLFMKVVSNIQTKSRQAANPPTCCPPSRCSLLLKRWCDQRRQKQQRLSSTFGLRKSSSISSSGDETIHRAPTCLPYRWPLLQRRWCDRR
jgi:hypothetical protein